MKRLILAALLIGLTGCSAKIEDRKNVVCFDDSVTVATYRGIAKDKIFVISKNGTHYFNFIDEQGEQVILDLAGKQCGIN